MAASKPEDDLASLVSAALSGQQKPQAQPAATSTTHPDPDFPAESFRLPPEAELEWLDRSVAAAAIYERDDSTKGTANPKAQHQHHTQQHHGSNRFSGPLKPPKSAILGLPKPVQRHSGYIGAPRKGGTNTRIFPKKRGKGGKSAAGGVEEPGSPKVSCFGKVKSERERCREEQRRMRREARDLQKEEEVEAARVGGSGEGSGGRSWWSCLLLGPLACCRGNPAVGSVEEESSDRRTPSSTSSSVKKKKQQPQNKDKKTIKDHRASSHDAFSATDRDDEDPSSPHSSSIADPPGLGALKRFASGRRSSSWGGGEFEANGGGSAVAMVGGLHADASGPVAPARRSVS